jgi:hypothetical protein
MKWYKVYLTIFVILIFLFLASCSPASSSKNCSNGGEICVSITTVPSFSIGAAVPVKISVSSTKDISGLLASLYTNADITLDGPKTWESNLSNPSIDQQSTAYWTFAIKGGQSLIFNRVLHFPTHEAYFTIIVWIVNPTRSVAAVDSFLVHITQEGAGLVYIGGTQFPPSTHPGGNVNSYGPGTQAPQLLQATPAFTLAVPTSGKSTPIAPPTNLSSPYPPPSTPTFTPTSVPYP